MHFHSDAANPLAAPLSTCIYPMHPATSYYWLYATDFPAGKSVAYNVSISQFAVNEVEKSYDAVIVV
jgi:hypothetical protein